MAPTTNLRQRKPAETIPSKRVPANTPQDYDSSQKKRAAQGPDLEPNIWVAAWMTIVFITGIVLIFYYKVDNRNNGVFSGWINENFPLIDRSLNNYALGKKEAPLFGASAAETTGLISLTEEELKEFDGTDPDKPIYLGINGTIFDVSASPAFYGPGGHYNHFVGKDATRAWITECWDEAEQFTWRLDDVNVMFMPKYMDEMLSDVSEGKFDEDGGGDLGAMGAMPQEMLKSMAEKAIARFGKVGPKAKAKRRVEDKVEADAKVQETLAHWVGFFANNAKYQNVGRVVLDESRPAPPAPCKKAMEKRPLKGGKLESLMGPMGNLMGGSGAAAGGAVKDAKKGAMPAAVREQIEKAKKEAAAAKDGAAEGVENIKEKVKDTADAAADTAESVKNEAGKKAKAAVDSAADGAGAVKEKAKVAADSAADAAGSAQSNAADAAETVKQKASEAGNAAADTAESVTAEAGKQAKAAGETYESVKQKAQQVKDEAVKQAAEGVAAGAEKVKQKAEEVKSGHEEL